MTVRVVTECENRKGEDQTDSDQLASAGIPIVDDNSSFNGELPLCPDSTGGTMHNKFAIVDGATVWAGSVNYTFSDYRGRSSPSSASTLPSLSALATIAAGPQLVSFTTPGVTIRLRRENSNEILTR